MEYGSSCLKEFPFLSFHNKRSQTKEEKKLGNVILCALLFNRRLNRRIDDEKL
jgi:hypothetical protein